MVPDELRATDFWLGGVDDGKGRGTNCASESVTAATRVELRTRHIQGSIVIDILRRSGRTVRLVNLEYQPIVLDLKFVPSLSRAVYCAILLALTV